MAWYRGAITMKSSSVVYIKILHGGSWITFFSIKTTSGNDLSEQEKAYTRPTSPIRWKGHCKSILSKKMTGIFFIVTRLQPKLTSRERFWTLMSGGAHHNIKWGENGFHHCSKELWNQRPRHTEGLLLTHGGTTLHLDTLCWLSPLICHSFTSWQWLYFCIITASSTILQSLEWSAPPYQEERW